MPIFARRRLQAMLDDLSQLVPLAKINDLLARIEHRNPQDALAGEFELGLLWSVKQVANLEIEPPSSNGSSCPDAYSSNLFGSQPALIEITALSDDTFSGAADMNRAANIICQFANRIKRGSGDHLYFEFLVESYYRDGRYHRNRRITDKFKLTEKLAAEVRAWLSSPTWPNNGSIRLSDSEIDAVVQWKSYVHPKGRTFCSMPAVAYQVEENTIFRALKRKERQLSGAPEGTLRCIFLGDAGCAMLRELKPFGVQEVCGDQVIKHFLKRSSVDVIAVFSPYRKFQVFQMPEARVPRWNVSLYTRTEVPSESDCSLVQKMVKILPRPQLEGYQARSWHRQGLFDPQGKGIYLGCKMTTKASSVSISISARMVLELLAGRITSEEFKNFTFRDHRNIFDAEFKRGLTIQGARIEKGGLDEDDDYLVFDMEHFGASALRNPRED